jgi:outer membrane protein, multidrug efflux system
LGCRTRRRRLTPIPQARTDFALSFPSDTLRQRAHVRAAAYPVAAALARAVQADAQRWPSFSIGGSIGLSAISAAALTNGASALSRVLPSVTERTREIGLRLAVGALEGEVLLQFSIEAVCCPHPVAWSAWWAWSSPQQRRMAALC